MAYAIEFFGRSAAAPLGEPIGPRLEDFASRRAAVAFAQRHRPIEAEGFRLYQDEELLRIAHWHDR